MEPFVDVSAGAALHGSGAAQRGDGGDSQPRALADLPSAGGVARSAPVTATEQILAGLWGELLSTPVSALDTFFALGGDSLLATQMGFGVRRALGVALPTGVLFEPWTLRRLAGWIDARRRAGGTAEGPPPLTRAPRDGPLPATLLQEFHWLQHQIDPDPAGSNMAYALRLGGALDVAALERALTEVVCRHEALRTTVPAPDGVPVQVVGAPGPVQIPRVDLSVLPREVRERDALQRAALEAGRPFDLERGPLLRTLLLRLDAREWWLLATVHHLVSDGWSMDVMVREMGALYGAFTRGQAAALPEPEVQYGDFAVWQRGWLAGPVLERYAAYWRERLAGAVPLDLAGEGPGGACTSPRRAFAFTLPAAPVAALVRLGVRESATLFMVLLAAFEALLVRYTGQDDVTVETPFAGRMQPELASTIGFFAQMALLRTDLSGDPAFSEAVRRVRETTLGAYDHQELPVFERLGPTLPRETAAYRRLLRIGFSLQETENETLVLGDLSVEEVSDHEPAAAHFDHLTVATCGQGLRGHFLYRVEVFSEAVVARAIGHYAEILDQVAADPQLRLSELVLSSAAAA